MTRAKVRRWTRAAVPNPWEYTVPTHNGTVHGRVPTWRRAIDRTLQLIRET